jgi:hypothetical protein
MAADRADVPLMRELVKAGADPFLPNADKSTPLMAAAGLGTSDPLEEAGTEDEALEAVKMLLDLGADINAVDTRATPRCTVRRTATFRRLCGCWRSAVPTSISGNSPTQREGRRCLSPEGYKAGRPQPSRPTIDALHSLMAAAGIPTDGTRPRIRDIYESCQSLPRNLKNRRVPVNASFAISVLVALAAVATAHGQASSEAPVPKPTLPNPYRLVPDWPTLPCEHERAERQEMGRSHPGARRTERQHLGLSSLLQRQADRRRDVPESR